MIHAVLKKNEINLPLDLHMWHDFSHTSFHCLEQKRDPKIEQSKMCDEGFVKLKMAKVGFLNLPPLNHSAFHNLAPIDADICQGLHLSQIEWD